MVHTFISPSTSKIFTFLLPIRCSYGKCNADSTPCALVVLDDRKVKYTWVKVSCEEQGSLVFSINHSSLHIFYSETQISNWLSLCSPIVFLIVRSELEQPVPPLARHLAGILNSQQNLSPSQKHCHLLAGMKKCVALPMIC